ncbi:endonuclease/exonuclease/phosphatase family metal-dependent hydrolase [Inhella inkyongensis]|uniref:Endonuclease/exonuclease/phosphatase family metal-dependent hydrolase n=1 Tax=Inhella inkyongensis TaxID=392593 RepID=A0A840S037_9BURK|nr:endonuclease/exonuclease/phosphatase family protein [Inhella inkyongensis]MBB5203163.1 endonuclease/exonuclease/phosphatase family metal-dependent hydrolase [Inhella inkyongensis]
MHTPPSAFHSVFLASANLLNLALPGRVFYPNQDAYGAEEYQRKIAWLGQQMARLNADVLLTQEVWDEAALREAVAASGRRYAVVQAPGAEQGAQGTPRLGLVSRWPVQRLQSLADFDPADHLPVPELGLVKRFERPVLLAELQGPQGQGLTVLAAHLKSKRPKFLIDAQGQALEDRDDPAIVARAMLRSLMIRAAEACALRRFVVTLSQGRRHPLVLVGDLNDGPQAVTTQLIAATAEVAYDKGAADTALFNAWDLQTEPALRRDMAYSHVHQGWPEMLDQIWVSEEFKAGSRFAVGDVKRVEVFNDHLHEGRDRTRSDHGFVRALLRWKI